MLTFTKEPHAARYTSDKVMIKDHYYYKGDDFSWNRPARMNQKYYPYYFKQHDENKEKIQDMKLQEVEDKNQLEEVRRERLMEKKASTKLNFETRIKEREVVQRMSNQPLLTNNFLELPEEDSNNICDIVAKRFNSGKHLRSDEFSWNNLAQASKKNVAVFLGNYSLRGEEEMLTKLKEKVENENKQEENEKQKKSEFHKKLRIMFLTRHEENMAKEDMITRPSTATVKCTSFFNASRPKSPNPRIPSLNLNGGLNLHAPLTNTLENNKTLENKRLETLSSPKEYDKVTRHSLAASIERIAQPKEPMKKEFNTNYNDCKGMLIKNMDGKVYYPGNNFYDAMVSQSKVFKNTMEENRVNKRDNSSYKTVQTRPPTSFSNKTRPPTSMSNKTIIIRPMTSHSRPMTSHSKMNYNSNPDFVSKPVISEGNLPKVTTEPFVTRKSLQLVDGTDSINSKELVLDEIETFENKFCKGSKKVGYAKVNLEEAYKLSETKGLSALQKIEAKKQEQLVK